MRRSHRLDGPLAVQYSAWLGGVARGDLGFSYVDREPVSSKIAERIDDTLLLNGVALLFSFAIAVPLGVAMATRGRTGAFADTFLVLLFSLPAFWVALLLVDLFVMRLSWLPLFGSESFTADSMSVVSRVVDRLRHLVLPVVCLSVAQIAMIARVTRAAMEEALTGDHIVAARARGVSERSIVLRHALRGALVPLISMLGVLLPFALSGSVVVERIFQWRGVGNLLLDSILARDYPVVMGLTLVTALIVLFTGILVDILYTLADPRVRVTDARS